MAYKTLRQPDNAVGTGRPFESLQSLTVAAANLSKFFWPSRNMPKDKRKLAEERARMLRSHLGIGDDSRLQSRDLRNCLEHWDERLDQWAAGSSQHLYLNRNIGDVRRHVRGPGGDSPPAQDIFLNYDPATDTAFFHDTELPLGPLVEEIETLYGKIMASETRDAAAQGAYWPEGSEKETGMDSRIDPTVIAQQDNGAEHSPSGGGKREDLPEWFSKGIPDEKTASDHLLSSREEMYKALDLYYTHVKHVMAVMFTLLSVLIAAVFVCTKLSGEPPEQNLLRLFAFVFGMLVCLLGFLSILILMRYYQVYVSALIFAARIHCAVNLQCAHPWLHRTIEEQVKRWTWVKSEKAFLMRRACSPTETFALYAVMIALLSLLSFLGSASV